MEFPCRYISEYFVRCHESSLGLDRGYILQSAFLHFNVNFFLDRQFRIDLTWDMATPLFFVFTIQIAATVLGYGLWRHGKGAAANGSEDARRFWRSLCVY